MRRDGGKGRRTAAVVVASVIAHGGVIAAAVMWWPATTAEIADVHAPRDARTYLSTSAAEQLPVMLIDLTPTPTPAPRPMPRSRPMPMRMSASRGPATTSTVEPPSPSPSQSPSAPTDTMRMRGPDLTLPEAVAERVGSGKPHVVERSGRVEPERDGYVIHDGVTDVAVDRDGTAHFHDKPDLQTHLGGLTPAGLGNMIARWYQDPAAAFDNRTFQDLPPVERAVPGGWDSGISGLPPTSNTDAPSAEMPNRTIATFDLTATAMRWAHVGDPYASRKRKLLDRSFAERAELGGAYRAQQLDRSAALMHDNLVAMWAAPGDAASHRAALFALWDECAEGDGPLGD
ncbi:MAG TPA: hypothetical protein VHV78_06750, partial [Gemmatimonadaceae bacterium]|nr:hypothetical protein [Gemmatimonadaceae bacterium]